MPRMADPDGLNRAFCYDSRFVERAVSSMPPLKAGMMRAERARNFAATYENLKKDMAKHSIQKACVMPVAPNVAFEDILEVSGDRAVVPFGSVDFTGGNEGEQVRAQLGNGAKGFKLHPILQKVDPSARPVRAFLEACPAGTVILVHTGYADYYFADEKSRQCIEFGAIEPIIKLCAQCRDLNFVLGHAGLSEAEDVLRLAPCHDNIYVDTSFQGPARIRQLINALGCERVLFASDWPWGFMKTALRCVEKGCANTTEFEHVTALNAATLLGLTFRTY